MVALYCQAYGDFRGALDQISHLGAVVKDKNDRVIPNPLRCDSRYRNAANDGPGSSAWLNAWPDLESFAPMAPENFRRRRRHQNHLNGPKRSACRRTPVPATPETLNRRNPTEERKNLPPRKQRFFTFEQLGEALIKRAAIDRGLRTPDTSPGMTWR
jgi:hypothetical protein